METESPEEKSPEEEAVSVAHSFIQQAIVRISHLEQLLLGLATLGFLGWGALLASSLTGQKTGASKGGQGELGLILFATVFSGSIACAFNGLFIGRMAINKNLIELERFVEKEQHLPRKALLYQTYFDHAGRWGAGAVYYASALFLPLMSLCSLALTGFQARDADYLFEGGGHLGWGIVVSILWCVSVGATLAMTIVAGIHIGKLLGFVYNKH